MFTFAAERIKFMGYESACDSDQRNKNHDLHYKVVRFMPCVLMKIHFDIYTSGDF